MITLDNAYHGTTGSCVELSPTKWGFGGLPSSGPPHVQKVPAPDTYRGLYLRNDPEAGRKYSLFIKQAIDTLLERKKKEGVEEKEEEETAEKLGGFICESIQGCGGQIVLPANYLKHVCSLIPSASLFFSSLLTIPMRSVMNTFERQEVFV
jgi:ethanolamine-phosphate phospho-lyase